MSDSNLHMKGQSTMLHYACRHGDLDLMDALLDKGFDINAHDNFGYTPLHLACISNHVTIVKKLLQARANIDDTDQYGWTALHHACSGSGNIECIRELLTAGISTDIQNNSKQTALHIACNKQKEDYVKELLNFNCDPAKANLQDHEGYTPLHVSVLRRDVSLVKLLLAHNVSFDIPDIYGQTPLYLSGHFNSWNCTIELLKVDRNINIQSPDGWTLLHHACLSHQVEIVSTLLHLGVHTNIRNHNGHTALNLAEKYKLHDLINLIKDYPMTKRAIN